MTEIIIFLEDIDPIVFFGTNNSLLDKIRSFFPKIKIMARGNEIKCMGEESEITIFAGQSGAGKSLFLQNLGVNWANAGLNVVYLSLELSEKLSCMRIDAMMTGYETRDVMRNIDDVHMKILEIKEYTHKWIPTKAHQQKPKPNPIF